MSEDKCGENDIDDIKLHPQHTHDAKNPDPSQSHGEECQQTQLQSSEGNPKEDEYNQSASKTDIVEVAGQGAGNSTVHSHEIESIAFSFQPVIQGIL